MLYNHFTEDLHGLQGVNIKKKKKKKLNLNSGFKFEFYI